MNIEKGELQELQLLCPNALVMEEKYHKYIFLPQLTIPINGVDIKLDCLLCPEMHSGYQTRLFLSTPMREKGKNWTSHHILEKDWHSHSWNGIPASLRLAQILALHIRSFK